MSANVAAEQEESQPPRAMELPPVPGRGGARRWRRGLDGGGSRSVEAAHEGERREGAEELRERHQVCGQRSPNGRLLELAVRARGGERRAHVSGDALRSAVPLVGLAHWRRFAAHRRRRSMRVAPAWRRLGKQRGAGRASAWREGLLQSVPLWSSAEIR